MPGRWTDCWLVIVIILSVSRTSFAQDPTLPILQLDEIVAQKVEVLETLSVLNIDGQQTRTLYYLNSQRRQWRQLPLPESFPQIPTTLQRSDGTYLIGTSYRHALERQAAGDVWIFDPDTALLTQGADSECGVVKALPGEGRWIIHEGTFCFTENGQRSGPITDLREPTFCESYYSGLGWYSTERSPDGDYVVGLICPEENRAVLYTYHIPSNTVTTLDTLDLPQDRPLKLDRWADSTHPIFVIEASKSNFNRFSRLPVENFNNRIVALLYADVTQPDSLHTVVSADSVPASKALVRYLDQPARYVWIPGEVDSTSDDCQIYSFHLDTLSITQSEHPVNGACELGIGLPEGRLYWDAGRLYRFDIDTGEADIVYTGEIGSVVSVSPGGRYVEIAVGDLTSVSPARDFNAVASGGPHMEIIDITTGDILLTVPYYISDPVVAPLLAPVVSWLDERTFRLGGGTVYEGGLVVIENNEIYLTRPDSEGRLPVPVEPLLQLVGDIPEAFHVELTSGEAETVYVSVWMWHNERYFELGRWRVRG